MADQRRTAVFTIAPGGALVGSRSVAGGGGLVPAVSTGMPSHCFHIAKVPDSHRFAIDRFATSCISEHRAKSTHDPASTRQTPSVR